MLSRFGDRAIRVDLSQVSFPMSQQKRTGGRTSLMGTSLPCIRHASRTTPYIFGRFCGFSLSIDAVRSQSSELDTLPSALTNQHLQRIRKLGVLGKFVTGVEDGHLTNFFKRGRVIT